MWAAIKSFWLNGWTEAAATNSATVTQAAPAIAATGTVRIVGSASVAQDAPSIAATGTVTGGAVVTPPDVGGYGGIPRWVVPQYRKPILRRITGSAAIVAPPPAIAATGSVGMSVAEMDLEELLLLGVLDFEEYLILLDDLAA